MSDRLKDPDHGQRPMTPLQHAPAATPQTSPLVSGVVPTDAYSAGVLSHAVPTEEARLRILERTLDPPTIALLERIGVDSDWRCLELGGGAGSVARWLARRCSLGQVTATDVDTRFLDRTREANLTVLNHDATRDEFPAGSFDLVHTRLMLHHLPGRNAVVARAVPWLVPGGWLVAEEPDFTCADASPYPPLRAYVHAFEAFMRKRIGTDYRWARWLPVVLAEAGLETVTMSVQAYHTGEGSGGAFWRASVAQAGPALVEAALLDADELADCLALLDDPDCHDLLFTVVAAWGRCPGG